MGADSHMHWNHLSDREQRVIEDLARDTAHVIGRPEDKAVINAIGYAMVRVAVEAAAAAMRARRLDPDA